MLCHSQVSCVEKEGYRLTTANSNMGLYIYISGCKVNKVVNYAKATTKRLQVKASTFNEELQQLCFYECNYKRRNSQLLFQQHFDLHYRSFKDCTNHF